LLLSFPINGNKYAPSMPPNEDLRSPISTFDVPNRASLSTLNLIDMCLMGYINNVLFTMAGVYNVVYQILYSEESAPLHNPFLWRYSSYIYIDTPSPGDPTYVLAGEVNDERFIRSVRKKFDGFYGASASKASRLYIASRC